MNMSRSARYLAVIILPAAALFVATFSETTVVERASLSATSTPAIVLVVATSSPSTTQAATSSSAAASASSAKKKLAGANIATSTPAAQVSFPAPQLITDQVSFAGVATALRSALVNVLCYAPAGSGLRSSSGSGIFIDPKGIILTNAHIGQHFLLADWGVSCVIRSGSPAVDSYEAALLYISPAWLAANPTVLTKAMANGNGEYDFALLAVTKSATIAPLPSSFPSVPLAHDPHPPGTPVVIASYGAQFLASSQIQTALSPTVVFGLVKDIFTFATSTVDVLSLGGSAAAQEGSSGGGVAEPSGTLAGTITTSTVTGTTDTRSLSAITASYIRAQYERETGSSLDTLLSEPVSDSIAAFKPQIAKLEAIITAGLP